MGDENPAGPTRRAVLGAAAAALTGVAGCTGEDEPSTTASDTATSPPTASDTATSSPTVTGTATSSPTVTGTATSSPTATGTAGTDCPPTLTVYEAGSEPVDEDAVVDYANLTASQRRTFHRARNESVEEFDDAWVDVSGVRYEGTLYRASVAVC